ncbi:hypothetical protein HUT19_26470 [Streptomyces sp. NA02950]|uniref:hypothetical protein n=1 Tax=Streptomyces sp. NA02950 TaxID=2742137 RepID=UPI00159182E9|nr:hypothetical protein [Streptomyces sp. NA02950]QKV94853.1 hypothetical protein HUT19_26470 [Streptomyces sp. NA02950]
MIESHLETLLTAGFTDRLGERDKKLLARRATLKSCWEPPRLYLPTNWWYAVPGETYEGLFTALDLHDRVPVTFDEGVGVEDLPTRSDAVPVFITPELDGWRLVFGHLDTVVTMDWDAMMGAAERLSAACGEAQMFLEDIAGGTDIWVVAEQGRIRRRYAASSDPEWVGEPLPWEERLLDTEDFDAGYDEPDSFAGTAGATTACGHLSVDPTLLDADTEVRGHGWLALNAPGVGHKDLDVLVH